ncbi:acetyltransferase [Enterobacter sp. KBR-315C3_2022]|uniref:acetyltransferase n=1 Tax=Enterobacter sp. KBR-315C3_2022 TaxID=3242494 RepID=UPI0035283396
MSKLDSPVYVIIGSGGHSRVLAEILQKLNGKITCVVSLTPPDDVGIFSNVKHLTDAEFLKLTKGPGAPLINGIGHIPYSNIREEVYDKYSALGYNFESIVSPDAIVSPSSILSSGVQVLPGAIVQYGVQVGQNTILNTGAIIEHDSIIGANCHIAPGSVICGGVRIGHSTIIGAGAILIQGVKIGDRCIIGAGAVVTKDIDSGSVCYPPRPHIDKITQVRS